MATSTPNPFVAALIASTASVELLLTVWVAPNCLAHSSFRSSRSTATIVVAPASLAPAIAASPTPPQPNTATDSPRRTPPVLIAAPTPAITPQPSRPAAVAGACGSTLVHWPECDERLLHERADAQRRGELRAVGQRHLLRGVVGVEAVLRLALEAGAALPADGPPVQDHEVADGHVGDALADRGHRARGLVAEQEREVVVDAALAVVQVGVAHPARLDVDDRLAGARVGHHDRLDARPGHPCCGR